MSCPSVPTHRVPTGDHIDVSSAVTSLPLSKQQLRNPALRLALPQTTEEEVVVSRRGRGGLGRLDSPPPINRYAGDWSICGRDLLSGQDADYDEVAGSESDGGKHTRFNLSGMIVASCPSHSSMLFQAVEMKRRRRKRRRCGLLQEEEVCTWTSSWTLTLRSTVDSV